MKIISIIIPVYNEEKLVSHLLEKVTKLDFTALGYDKELIIINDGSKDSSDTVIQSFLKGYTGKHEYIQQTNHGKGYGIKQGIKHATGDVYVVQDADLEYEPKDLLVQLKYLEKHNLDFCYGSRVRGFAKFGLTYSTVGFFLGGLTLSILTTLLTFRKVTDEPTCYKMYRKKCKDILLSAKENDFAREPAVTMMLLRKGYSYGEIPIHYFPRKEKQGKKIKLIDGWRAIKTLFIYRCKPLKNIA